MRERVVVKWGGGLITKKDELKTVRTKVLDQLTLQLVACLDHGVDVILVHGAGSFGHLKAKQYRLADGKVDNADLPEDMTQEEAVLEVRSDMLELNQHVMDALTKHDGSAVSLPPHHWANGVGKDFEGDLTMFQSAPSGIVVVTHGDVVDCGPPAMFGVLSGDDLVYRLATEVSGVKRLVFAVGGVEGVLSEPPTGKNNASKLLEVLTRESVFEGEHMTELDVTGGIGLKVSRGFQAADHGIAVHLVSGEHDQRVTDACLGRTVRGTVLRP